MKRIQKIISSAGITRTFILPSGYIKKNRRDCYEKHLLSFHYYDNKDGTANFPEYVNHVNLSNSNDHEFYN